MKRVAYLAAGICAFATSIFLALNLISYLNGGAGLQVFLPWISNLGVLLGAVHVVGMGFGAALAFALGIVWCSEGLVPNSKRDAEPEEK